MRLEHEIQAAINARVWELLQHAPEREQPAPEVGASTYCLDASCVSDYLRQVSEWLTRLPSLILDTPDAIKEFIVNGTEVPW